MRTYLVIGLAILLTLLGTEQTESDGDGHKAGINVQSITPARRKLHQDVRKSGKKPKKPKPGKVLAKRIAKVRAQYVKNHDNSIKNLKDTSDIQGFLSSFKTCSFLTGLKCAFAITTAIFTGCSKSPNPLKCVEREIPEKCINCISRVCKVIPGPLPCEILPSLCCKLVEWQPTHGPDCNRDCTKDSQDFRECRWNFTVRNQLSDQPGRMLDGRIRKVLTYNKEIPGPGIVVCELDRVVINLKNEIDGTFEDRRGQSNGTTLHMHGIRRWQHSFEDGVPGINQCEIKSQTNFTYTMTADDDHENAPPGTYWYHSHVGSQRTNGLYGKLIIKPRIKSNLYDIDDAANSLILQEWYLDERKNVPMSILINGKGRIGEKKNSIPTNVSDDDAYLDLYNKGKKVCFDLVDNPDYPNLNTKYEEFNVIFGKAYRFRIIGAISQGFPLCVTIEGHKFTAIATDSIDFQPVKDVDVVCLAAGERYDIVINTKNKKYVKTTPYKINVFGNACETSKYSPLCTVAWLKYPGQTVDPNYFADSTCNEFKIDSYQKVLNPIMGADFMETTNDITLNKLKAKTPPSTINLSMNRNYVFFKDITFNSFEMTYPNTPFLFQSPANETNRCGPNCDNLLPENDLCDNHLLPTKCTDYPNKTCQCEHVVHQPHIASYAGFTWWFETILINPYNEDMQVAHPIHQHGGWYRVLAVKQYDRNVTVTREFIMTKDTECFEGKNCLPRNYDNPVQKDTIQVPVNGYVIFRTPLDNSGTWIVHCHINHHVESGMAMVFQIGGLDEKFAGIPIPLQKWNLGQFQDEVNELSCPQNTYQNIASIDWFSGMKPITDACVKPGQGVTFTWTQGHNVNIVTEDVYDNCRKNGYTFPNNTFTDTTPTTGDYYWPGNFTLGPHYFACGVGNGWHCQNLGLKAKITVKDDC